MVTEIVEIYDPHHSNLKSNVDDVYMETARRIYAATMYDPRRTMIAIVIRHPVDRAMEHWSILRKFYCRFKNIIHYTILYMRFNFLIFIAMDCLCTILRV